MSKGVGRIGSKGLGARIRAAVAKVGGVSKSGLHPGGFRTGSLAHWRGVYAGKSPAEATKIATSLKEPIKIALYTGKRGGIEFLDGRHRLTTAKEAGATHISAHVIVYGERTGRTEWRGKIRI